MRYECVESTNRQVYSHVVGEVPANGPTEALGADGTTRCERADIGHSRAFMAAASASSGVRTRTALTSGQMRTATDRAAGSWTEPEPVDGLQSPPAGSGRDLGVNA